MDETTQTAPLIVGEAAGGAGGSPYPAHDLEAMSVADRYGREIVRGFAPYLGRRVLEVGAGIGNISTLLLERRPERLDLIEPDAGVYAALAERVGGWPGVVAHRGYLGAVIASGGVGEADSVVSVNVLEHVEDDVGELALMHSVLRPGGHLCLWVPALPALYSDLDRELGHHRRYRRAELAAKLTDAGFETVFLHYRDLVGMVAWFVACRLLGQRLTRGRVRLYDRVVMPAAAAIGRWARPPIGKNLVAVARRP